MDSKQFMQRALTLAADARAAWGPNPRVGAVIVDPHGDIVGEGFHQGAGAAHAEIVALTQAGERARGSTVFVTLEPCNHSGRTGPCTQALIDAGVRRVVFGSPDPNPVAQGGSQRLAQAGIEVQGDVLLRQARELNDRWIQAVERGKPFTILKVAATLDGRTSAADGSSRWITSTAARLDVQQLRANVDAIATGTGTIIGDDPQLTVRDVNIFREQPLRVVVGESDVPPDSRVFDAAARTIVYRTRDLERLMNDLTQESVRLLLVESGPRLTSAFLASGLVDEVRWYVASKFLGSGSIAVNDIGIGSVSSAQSWNLIDVTQFDNDVRLTLRPESIGKA